MRDMAAKGRSGSHTKPERLARGDRSGSRLHPERLARGEKHHSKTKPECLARGEAHGLSKLTSAQVIDIRAKHAAGSKHRELAELFRVSKTLIGCIVKRKIWLHVP